MSVSKIESVIKFKTAIVSALGWELMPSGYDANRMALLSVESKERELTAEEIEEIEEIYELLITVFRSMADEIE